MGNQHQKIFFSKENYLFFIRKMRKYLLPVSDILAWCLMPNHFHFLIAANKNTCKQAEKQKLNISQFSENLRLLLSQYTQAINKEQNLSGSLFRQNKIQNQNACIKQTKKTISLPVLITYTEIPMIPTCFKYCKLAIFFI